MSATPITKGYHVEIFLGAKHHPHFGRMQNKSQNLSTSETKHER